MIMDNTDLLKVRQELIYRGLLGDVNTLSDYNIKNGDDLHIHLMMHPIVNADCIDAPLWKIKSCVTESRYFSFAICMLHVKNITSGQWHCVGSLASINTCIWAKATKSLMCFKSLDVFKSNCSRTVAPQLEQPYLVFAGM